MTNDVMSSARCAAAIAALALLGMGAAVRADAQVADRGVPGGCNTPVSERSGEMGCYVTATTELDSLPKGPVYWHLYNYPTVAAAEAAKGPQGTVVESFARVWLFTIAPKRWHPAGGKRVAVVGPLPVERDRKYTARYLEAVSRAGMHSEIHRHAGPEAWYMLSGTQCLEMPGRTIMARAGRSAIVPGGPPMELSTIGKEKRRAVVLVLHDSTQPWVIMAHDWTPKGLCGK